MINISKLHKELEQAGIPIHGVSSDGRIDFKPEATQAQRDQAKQIVSNHDPREEVPIVKDDTRWNALTAGQKVEELRNYLK